MADPIWTGRVTVALLAVRDEWLAHITSQEKAESSKELNRLHRKRGDLAYQFADDSKIKKIDRTKTLQDQPAYGIIVLGKLGGSSCSGLSCLSDFGQSGCLIVSTRKHFQLGGASLCFFGEPEDFLQSFFTGFLQRPTLKDGSTPFPLLSRRA